MAPRQGTEPRPKAGHAAGVAPDELSAADVSRPGAIADRIVDAILAGTCHPKPEGR